MVGEKKKSERMGASKSWWTSIQSLRTRLLLTRGYLEHAYSSRGAGLDSTHARLRVAQYHTFLQIYDNSPVILLERTNHVVITQQSYNRHTAVDITVRKRSVQPPYCEHVATLGTRVRS